MSFDRLLASFEKIGDDPDHIQKFRKIAIALAISGDLDTPSTTMPPEKILEAVERVKATLVKKGELPKQKKFDPLTDDDFPESFSGVSRFARLGSLARIQKGQTGIQQAQPGTFPLVVTAAERATCDHFDFDGTAAIVPLVSSTGHGNASLNRLHYQEGKFALGTILVAIFPHDPNLISARFIFEYLSAFKDELLVARMTGTANVTLSVGRVAEVPVPLVCPEVQAKVDELMALCDRLEEARTSREAVRDRLTAASLARLTALDTTAADFQSHARFALQSLPTLTTRPDQIKPLRQTILNLAVRGRLVKQEAADGKGSDLMNRVLKLPWAKKRKIIELQPDDAAMVSAFNPPSNWCWATVQSLVRPNEITTYGILKPEWVENGIPTVRVTEMKTGVIDVAKLPRCRVERAEKFQKTTLVEGDLLVSKDGTIGKTAFVPPELAGGNITQHMLRFPIVDLVNWHYIRLVIDSPFCQSWMLGETKGVALQGVNVGDFRRMPIPLPPLAEQHRIVAKVDALMALCDRLEASLTQADNSRQRLLAALLHEALDPVAKELEAAE